MALIETHPKDILTIKNGSSVTRSGDLLDFGQLLNAFGNTKFAQISHILKEFL